jgi:hypothetical protein
MPRKSGKLLQNPAKKRGFYTPEPVQARVIARHMAGESNRRIAGEEHIDPETVGRILSRQEVAQMIAGYQSNLLIMVPKAIDAYNEALESDDLRLKAAMATKLLEGVGVFHRDGIERTIEAAQAADRHREEQRLQVMGEMMDLMLQQKQRNGVNIPPEIERAGEEARKRIEGTTTSP